MKTAVEFAMVCIVCLVSAAARADDSPDDKSRLQGVWALSSGETNGRPLGEVLRKKGLSDLRIKFSGDLMTMTGFGTPGYTYHFTLQPMEQPKGMRLVTVETHGKAPKGSVLHCIYEMKGEELRLCLPSDSTVERPKKFEAPSGSRLSLLVLSRPANNDNPRSEPADAR
ncbi:TIGR03067 domain-containing protein [Stieleria sp. ICT_E10.1]|uniref:TIGR03067 domain-containing protein n=1 Tax=Stieleria sedimenti TaxID=2976331 RepID=UPI002180881C|nr:TIGR03067 domain-containing protein [Stieleria sedimenti]MCS7467337.1 TIGR03067 domain-containing protein [Stieleria sedimenti]